MDSIRDAINSGVTGEKLASIPIPSTYRAAVIEKQDEQMFAGVASRDKDPRKSIKLRDVPVPELAPDEALVAVMASSINFNTVWSAIFEPISTF
ncbi:MAG: crotonyl-CoA carboxylase/reductase, partial [Ilumatobacteraceae bacterium]